MTCQISRHQNSRWMTGAHVATRGLVHVSRTLSLRDLGQRQNSLDASAALRNIEGGATGGRGTDVRIGCDTGSERRGTRSTFVQMADCCVAANTSRRVFTNARSTLPDGRRWRMPACGRWPSRGQRSDIQRRHPKRCHDIHEPGGRSVSSPILLPVATGICGTMSSAVNGRPSGPSPRK